VELRVRARKAVPVLREDPDVVGGRRIEAGELHHGAAAHRSRERSRTGNELRIVRQVNAVDQTRRRGLVVHGRQPVERHRVGVESDYPDHGGRGRRTVLGAAARGPGTAVSILEAVTEHQERRIDRSSRRRERDPQREPDEIRVRRTPMRHPHPEVQGFHHALLLSGNIPLMTRTVRGPSRSARPSGRLRRGPAALRSSPGLRRSRGRDDVAFRTHGEGRYGTTAHQADMFPLANPSPKISSGMALT